MKIRSYTVTLVCLLGLSSLILSFQNCGGGYNFNTTTPTSALSAAPVAATPAPAAEACVAPKVNVDSSCLCPAGSNDNGTTCVSCDSTQIFDSASLTCVAAPVVCQPGYSYDGHSCVAISATCNSFVEVTDSTFVIPARDVNKTCYYIKLVNATTTRSSQTLDYVLSRNHDSGSVNRAPSVIGQKEISFLLQADREVVLSADSHGGMDISVDNYILIEANYDGLTSENLWASGTGDVPPLDSTGNPFPIQVHDKPVINWFPYGSGGTATFHAIDLSTILTSGKKIDFIASALDCGGGTNSSDAYLLFR